MTNERDVVLIDGVRTPFVKAGSRLKDVHPAELGKIALKELLARTEIDPADIEEVVIGNTGSPSDAVNVSRVVALRSGIPLKTSAYTVHRNCASALESITSSFDKIRSGTYDVMVAGGTESMSQMPMLLTREITEIIAELNFAKSIAKKWQAVRRIKVKYLKPRISLVEGLTDPFAGINMGQTAEILAREFGLSRKEQDEYALESHQKAVAFSKSGRASEEIAPIFIPPKFKEVVAQDIGPRDGQSLEALGKLSPYFDRRYGTVTVGNACPITDGAAMLLVTSRKRASELGLKPLARIRGYAFAGLEPERMGLGPVYATPLALKRAGLTMKDIDLVELNEAFAAQVLACQKAFASQKFAEEKLGLGQAVGEIDSTKLNVNGGAIAIGHPVGATGTRLVLTVMKELKRRNKQFGLATLCIGGGQGGAVIVEREA